MNITLNGKKTVVSDSLNIQALLESLKLHDRSVAVELNRQVVYREDYGKETIRENDTIEIVQFVGGG